METWEWVDRHTGGIVRHCHVTGWILQSFSEYAATWRLHLHHVRWRPSSLLYFSAIHDPQLHLRNWRQSIHTCTYIHMRILSELHIYLPRLMNKRLEEVTLFIRYILFERGWCSSLHTPAAYFTVLKYVVLRFPLHAKLSSTILCALLSSTAGNGDSVNYLLPPILKSHLVHYVMLLFLYQSRRLLQQHLLLPLCQGDSLDLLFSSHFLVVRRYCYLFFLSFFSYFLAVKWYCLSFGWYHLWCSNKNVHRSNPSEVTRPAAFSTSPHAVASGSRTKPQNSSKFNQRAETAIVSLIQLSERQQNQHWMNGPCVQVFSLCPVWIKTTELVRDIRAQESQRTTEIERRLWEKKNWQF